MSDFEKIFNGLNNGASYGNPAYNMQAVAQTFPTETAGWNGQTAREYSAFAWQKIEEMAKAGGPEWKPAK
jgi:hypothetical protein